MEPPKPTAHTFKYVKPQGENVKQLVKLARTDRMVAMVQVIKQGGENTLHSHKHFDGFWMVLKGRANFYGEGDELIGSLGPHEGILVPREFPYWFESGGEGELELLQIEAFDIPLPVSAKLSAGRTDFVARKRAEGSVPMIDAERA